MLVKHRMVSGQYSHVVRMDSLGTLGSSRTLKSIQTICHYVRTDANLNYSKLLGTDGLPNGKFSSSGWMLLSDEHLDGIPRLPDGCKGTELTDLNSAQSLLKAHN
jgi:hypothetical protein